MIADGKELDVGRTMLVEIKEIGTTKIILPERAQEKLGLKPAKVTSDPAADKSSP